MDEKISLKKTSEFLNILKIVLGIVIVIGGWYVAFGSRLSALETSTKTIEAEQIQQNKVLNYLYQRAQKREDAISYLIQLNNEMAEKLHVKPDNAILEKLKDDAIFKEIMPIQK